MRNEITSVTGDLLTNKSEPQKSQLLQTITAETANTTGNEFFRILVRQLVDMLQIRCAYVTECANVAMTRVRTLIYLEDNQYYENLEWDLADTPCESVIAGSVAYYPQGVSMRFAKATAESFLGLPLRDRAGNVLGHLAITDSKPMAFHEKEIAILQIFADRASTELVRQRIETALRQSQKMLESENFQLHQQIEQQTERQAGQATLLADRSLRAGELHDSVVQLLYSVTLLAESWRRQVQNGNTQELEVALAEIGSVSSQALKEMRDLSTVAQYPSQESRVRS